MSDEEQVPKCENCGAEHSWLLSLNSQVRAVNFECDECGWQQTRVLFEEADAE
jgi:predicted RNA-binding Zn-ribbon protein involved in translation (DUF1610 family)